MSNINPQNIDGTYPIAGQDNNSQGFRDNFTNTVNNFTFAAAELTDLQQNAVLKASLGSVGQTGTPTNDLNYAYLTHAQLIGSVQTKNPIGNVTSASGLPVDWSTGHWQTAGLTDTTTSMSFASTWPAANYYTKLRLQVLTYANVCALTFPSTVTNVSSLQGYTAGTTVSLPAGSKYVFEFTTDDQGSTIAVQDILRNYSGAQVETGYQQFKPVGNVAVTANVNVNRVLLHPTGTIVSFGANVTLPNTQVDGTIISISSNVTIASLAITPNWNGIVNVSPFGNVTNVTAGTVNRFMYIAADKIWYKIA